MEASLVQKSLSHIPFSSLSSIPDLTSSLLLFLASGVQINEGVFTNVSVEPTWRWYFAMTPFESMFLGLIILQFAVLNMFGIFPLNLSSMFHGMPSGRRKREAFEPSKAKRDIASQMLKLMKKLDPDQCSFKAICELQRKSCSSNDYETQIPYGVRSLLSALTLSAKKRKQHKEMGALFLQSNISTSSLNDDNIVDAYKDEVLPLYEDALRIGNEMPFQNVSACETNYPHCPANGEEIFGYVKSMHILDDFF